ncbi:MAG TPA: DNA repair ATPase [Verrucomicrobiae bacterium]|nr:DNA repair ATPase [Verrucomicrobiae bacterium]
MSAVLDAPAPAPAPAPPPALDQGTYEILRARLAAHSRELQARLEKLNRARQEVFGAIETALVATERITTGNNCIPRDMIPVGQNRFLFGYNVHLGLRSEVQLADVFAVYQHEAHRFVELPLDLIADRQFEVDFKNLYRYYKHAVFSKFSLNGPHLFMEFRVGKAVTDIKTFKWLCTEQGPKYLGNRFDHEYTYPPCHEFDWTRTHRELHRHGLHPHISIRDRVFVECIGGDLTIKVEDNTDTGEGIYAEPVEQRDQTLDDAEIFYATVGSLILLKVRPYQEKDFRYLVFNEKIKQVRRIDAIADACVLLPDGQGIVFPRGYYLQNGEFKLFELPLTDMVFNKRVHSPDGENVLFVFYNRDRGDYVLLSYNLISRVIQTPILCGGFSLFDNGEMAVFRHEPEPQRHHVIQVWQTPYVSSSWQAPVRSDSFLYKVGNPALVRCLAECQEVIALAAKDDTFAGLYHDLIKRSGDVLDSYFWLDRPDAFQLHAPLAEIRATAVAALAEFDKVIHLRRTAATQVQRLAGKTAAALRALATERFDAIGRFTERLAELRVLRGELIALKDLRYADLSVVNKCEAEVAAEADRLAQRTAQFLLQAQALAPFSQRLAELQQRIPRTGKVTEARALEDELRGVGKELDLLIETVTALKIQDATETTRIVEAVSGLYAVLNQARAALKQRLLELRGAEAVAEFASQSRLLEQGLASLLDLCGTPEQCAESLNRLLVQVEELEARFADFDEFVVQLSEKRAAFSAAFEARKLELIEARHRKAGGLLAAAERILNAIRHRAEHLGSAQEIHGYFAGDPMVDKVRGTITQLIELGDSVKADDIQGRLKAVREEALRQLKDRQDLFAGGKEIIQLGRHQFRVNTQELDLTIVPREGRMCLHLAGTNFFEPVTDADFLATQDVWDLEVSSESPQLYRSEYLAGRMFGALEEAGRLEEAAHWTETERLDQLRAFTHTRFTEGYVKGVHDADAALILGALLELHRTLGLLRYAGQARACAGVFWHLLGDGETKALLTARLRGGGALQQLFPVAASSIACRQELREALTKFVRLSGLFPEELVEDAARFLYDQIRQGSPWTASAAAVELRDGFKRHLTAHRFTDRFQSACHAAQNDGAALYGLLRDWMRAYALTIAPVHSATGPDSDTLPRADEAAWLLLLDPQSPLEIVTAQAQRELTGLRGSHPKIREGRLCLQYVDFMQRFRLHQSRWAPAFARCREVKKRLIEDGRARLRLDEFKPRVLTTFVRNRLIDSVYLPLVGDNLAKQIGIAGETKRTDRMGLLLLISPPGYGKTTLMEYLANRLGLVFVKINGPAIGSKVTSLDPAEASNAAAREELTKLNLAFAMGDNVMICLDDIQHLHAEFLQKFIPLCDSQRRIEGLHQGQARTYDLRGRKVVMVMAGNPYTESGDKFQLPDMLANRADTYNLGDVLGGHLEAFKLSYLENAATSNPTLARVVTRSPQDLIAVVRLAERGPEGVDFEGTYSPEELAEFVGVIRKLMRVRDVVLRVNEEYIRSAAQADAYRSEPRFQLQGSYRNMNRLAEKISSVMNDAEIEALLHDHYRNEAQTLAQGAEANQLKFKELLGTLTSTEAARWTEIKKIFRKNLLLRPGEDQDPVGQVVQKLAAFYDGLDSIKEVLAAGLRQLDQKRPEPQPGSVAIVMPTTAVASPAPTPARTETPPGSSGIVREFKVTPETLQKIWEVLRQQPLEAGSEPTPPPPDLT